MGTKTKAQLVDEIVALQKELAEAKRQAAFHYEQYVSEQQEAERATERVDELKVAEKHYKEVQRLQRDEISVLEKSLRSERSRNMACMSSAENGTAAAASIARVTHKILHIVDNMEHRISRAEDREDRLKKKYKDVIDL